MNNYKKFEASFDVFILLFGVIVIISSLLNVFDTDRAHMYAIIGAILSIGSGYRLYKVKKLTEKK
ncbi:hypothetical protein [Evansella cellulosilytica]|uniref:Uncharacterized protein n=1 Tax=Evansella cellulosilytica (strain ATCC 21833 / DSM 2522 / FERM P-1141 / JCM 9156 / N-4) TaxID=649639 RepID=E6TZD2_EVAC2|nr:hypothetical protein [Evansella cellulosilytica]ADU28994.1 hypothetical protein Bcell_0712 [Evansella cellulosilytica DSM 2522]